MTHPGFFLVLEGGDGVGKSTQAQLLTEWLGSPAGGFAEVIHTREPGGTELGVALRDAVMHGGHVAPRAEALLYAADRAHHIATVVRPALERGAAVVQDRYVDSSIVYQGGARALGDEVENISRWATEGLMPDLTVVLDMKPSADRMARDLDRVEAETASRAQEIRQAYRDLARAGGDRYVVVEADRDPASVSHDIQQAVTAALESRG